MEIPLEMSPDQDALRFRRTLQIMGTQVGGAVHRTDFSSAPTLIEMAGRHQRCRVNVNAPLARSVLTVPQIGVSTR